MSAPFNVYIFSVGFSRKRRSTTLGSHRLGLILVLPLVSELIAVMQPFCKNEKTNTLRKGKDDSPAREH